MWTRGRRLTCRPVGGARDCGTRARRLFPQGSSPIDTVRPQPYTSTTIARRKAGACRHFWGSDPEAVRRFAQLLRDRQEALERTRSILEPAAQCDPIWKGPDGDSFRIAVRTDVLPVLIDVTSRFSTLAGEADAHADEQDGASAASDPVGVQTHLPPPASPRPEAPSRAGREGGRAHDRRGDGSEVGPPRRATGIRTP